MSFVSGAEWIETDGLGGFSSGTESTVRTRRYHALLLSAATPPTGRRVLVNGFDAVLETERGSFALTSQRYAPDVVSPDGAARRAAFSAEPWPRWTFRAEDGTEVEHEIVARHGAPVVAVFFRPKGAARGAARLRVRPFLSGRDYHALHRENPGFRFEPEERGRALVFRPYDGVPAIVTLANGAFERSPHWYRNFLYSEERDRGLDHVEDLASPGEFVFDLAQGEAAWVVAADGPESRAVLDGDDALAVARRVRESERRRRAGFRTPFERAADAYVVRRGAGSGKTLVAGYPWFTDWGRDTFISLRGLLARRPADRRAILLEWAGAVSEGMLPNRFPDSGEAPEYNSVDASLWFVVAAGECLREKPELARADRETLRGAIAAILDGYARGTRHGIRADAADALLAAGEPGVQLTWMDAKVGDRVITPRIGKPVEIQALWANALAVGSLFDEKWRRALARARESFAARFWDAERGFLRDVVDADHVPGKVDAAFRPNQIYAVGGLPVPLLEGERARRVVAAVEAKLVTPAGLRSLAPDEPGYAGRYAGGVAERDGAYHQGTVWPFLLGPFVEAWARVNGGGAAAWAAARERFVAPLLARIAATGVAHVPEIADGDPPHGFRGCPFQAWSLGELLRVEAESARAAAPPARSARAPRNPARR